MKPCINSSKELICTRISQLQRFCLYICSMITKMSVKDFKQLLKIGEAAESQNWGCKCWCRTLLVTRNWSKGVVKIIFRGERSSWLTLMGRGSYQAGYEWDLTFMRLQRWLRRGERLRFNYSKSLLLGLTMSVPFLTSVCDFTQTSNNHRPRCWTLYGK